MKSILGISAFYHDSAACLLKDGEIISAAQEERFSRKKHDPSYPHRAIEFVLKYGNLKLSEVDQIVFFEKPFLKFERLLETYVAFVPRGFVSFAKAMPLWIKEKLFQKNLIFNILKVHDNDYKSDQNIFFSDHHLSHAASAFYPSPFNEAIVLTADGVGEWATTTISIAKSNQLKIVKEIHFPHSLGLLYSAFTYYTGFKVNSGEYKLMGLAPYGNPRYVNEILDNLIDIKNDGSFRLNQKYFSYATGLKMVNKKFEILFGKKARDPSVDKIDQFHMDIASSIQNVIEDIVIKICTSLNKEYKIKNLCLAGGVALNCVVNGKILEKKLFDNIWVQPASGDAGGSLGAALGYWFNYLKSKRKICPKDSMANSYLGPKFTDEEIKKQLDECGANYSIYDNENILDLVADDLANSNAVGWFHGKAEFGPRSLGSRSILADPRDPNMQKNLNLKIKFRESFRPFAPVVLEEKASEWFDMNNKKSPYMLFVHKVKKNKLTKKIENNEISSLDKVNEIRSQVPAITHIDNSARVQTIGRDSNKALYNLITKFEKKTNCPVLVNTSFNVRGEPIVNTPSDAFNCFMGTELDYLVIGDCILDKSKQDPNLKKDYTNEFELD